MRAVRWNKETARDGSIILSCLCGIALGGTVAGAVNNVYVAHRFAESLDDAAAGMSMEVAAKVERAWEFIQVAGIAPWAWRCLRCSRWCSAGDCGIDAARRCEAACE